MRAAIYARYSSDRQNPRSIDDQIQLCREHAASIGADVVDVFTDPATSGAHAVNRPGLQALLAAAAEGRFDVVVAEALDRLARSQRDTADIHERLQFHGVEIVTPSRGTVDALQIGFEGTINAVFLRDLRAKIRRGQAGRVADGFSPGGLAYGYRVVRRLGPDGEPVRGLREIDPGQADVVRRIFAEYVAGRSPRSIAQGLNRERVPSPKGGRWSASTINGNRKRRSGILWNELYAGFLVWGRTRMVKNPETGRRIHRPTDQADWKVAEIPDLRIVDGRTWDAAQARKATYAAQPAEHARRPKRPLSGLLRCGLCGGSYTIRGPDRYACSARRETGTCSNAVTVVAQVLEDRVFEGLRRQLLEPARIREYVRQVNAELERRRRQADRDRRRLESELAAADRAIDNLVGAIESGADATRIRDRLAALEAERDELAAGLEDLPDPVVVDMIPNLADVYARKIDQLQASVNAGDAGAEAAEILRALFSQVVIFPGDRRGAFRLELHTSLPRILGLATGETGAGSVLAVVAEEGLEPPTRGL